MKVNVLEAVADHRDADAGEVAGALGSTYGAAAMALLRACRAGLLTRVGTSGRGPFRYLLTTKGWERLAYLGGQRHPARHSRLGPSNPRQGDDDMRTKKLHSGLYHCPECDYEVTLTAEASLKCDNCDGRLYQGELPDERWFEEEEGLWGPEILAVRFREFW